MEEVIGVAKFEDIKKGNILWEVYVVLAHDGRVEVHQPKKIIPTSDPYLIDNNKTQEDWVFTCKGLIPPSSINEYGILTPDGRTFMIDWDNHCRLFRKRKHALNYALVMRNYKMTEYELKMHLEMAIDFGEDAFGEPMPDKYYPEENPSIVQGVQP